MRLTGAENERIQFGRLEALQARLPLCDGDHGSSMSTYTMEVCRDGLGGDEGGGTMICLCPICTV
jgi:hypothetical protein